MNSEPDKAGPQSRSNPAHSFLLTRLKANTYAISPLPYAFDSFFYEATKRNPRKKGFTVTFSTLLIEEGGVNET